jgi:hypothetical protein
MKIFLESHPGNWSVGLTMIVILFITIFFILMLLNLVTFDQGHWWDLTVGIAVPVEIIAFVLSIIALRKTKDRSVLVYLSLIIGICAVVFLFTHSLYIHD